MDWRVGEGRKTFAVAGGRGENEEGNSSKVGEAAVTVAKVGNGETHDGVCVSMETGEQEAGEQGHESYRVSSIKISAATVSKPKGVSLDGGVVTAFKGSRSGDDNSKAGQLWTCSSRKIRA